MSEPRKKSRLQRLRESTKRGKAKRISTALKNFLRKANPAAKYAGATVTRLKGGGFTIRPIKAVKRGRR